MKYISSIPGEKDALPFPRRLALMGCTGSIGTSTLRVLEAWKDSGRFAVTDVVPEGLGERELLGIAAAAEMYSQHPIARAIRQASSAIVDAKSPVISAQCLRVAASDGHMAAVSVSRAKGSSRFIV